MKKVKKITEVQRVFCKCGPCGVGRMQHLCMFVPKQLVLQARFSHGEVDNCNFDAHLKGNSKTHTHKMKLWIQTVTILHEPRNNINCHVTLNLSCIWQLLSNKKAIQLSCCLSCCLHALLVWINTGIKAFTWCCCSPGLVLNKRPLHSRRAGRRQWLQNDHSRCLYRKPSTNCTRNFVTTTEGHKGSFVCYCFS